LLLLALWWLISITAARLSAQITASATLTQIPDSWWVLFPLIQGILLIPILALLAWLVKYQPARGVLTAWLWGSFYILLLSPVSLIPLTSTQIQALLTAGMSLLLAFLVDRFTHHRVNHPRVNSTGFEDSNDLPQPGDHKPGANDPRRLIPWRLTWIILPAFAIPWLAWGALGSMLDTLLMLVAGLAFGWTAYRILDRILLPAFSSAGFSSQATFLTGGFTAAILLAVLSSGLGFAFGCIQLLLAIALFPFGWIAVRFLQLQGQPSPFAARGSIFRRTPVPWLLGIATAIPLAFIDPDELALITSAAQGEIFLIGLQAAAVSMLIGFAFAFGFLVAIFAVPDKGLPDRPAGSFGLPVGAVLFSLLAVGIYIFFGQPGFFGEGLLVLMDSQADLSATESITDPAERRQAVYDTLVSHAERSQADLNRLLDRLRIDHTPYYLVNGIQVHGDALLHLLLLIRPEVSEVLTIPYLRPLPAPLSQTRGDETRWITPQWNLTLIGADRVWDEFGVTGAGILIGQSDSGAQWDHPDLADSYRGRDGDHSYDWYDPWDGSTQPQDINGHGTHTLGSALGNLTGVAPDAEWIACANLQRNLGNPAYYLECMQFMLAPFPIGGDAFTDGDPQRGANILNNSWGCPEFEGCRLDTLLPAVSALTQAGIFVVASAGNDGPFCASLDEPIAIYSDVLTVGAVDEIGSLAFFSSIGPVDEDGSNRVKPDITAPGEFVLSAMPGGTYGRLSGTSMASPHVAGVVALMWSANPRLIGDIERTRQILFDTSKPPEEDLIPQCSGVSDIPSTATGYGMVDAYAAVKAAIELK
jgi:hypothetical protein